MAPELSNRQARLPSPHYSWRFVAFDPLQQKRNRCPASRVAIDPLHQEEQWVPGVEPRGREAYRGPVALPVQRVMSMLTD